MDAALNFLAGNYATDFRYLNSFSIFPEGSNEYALSGGHAPVYQHIPPKWDGLLDFSWNAVSVRLLGIADTIIRITQSALVALVASTYLLALPITAPVTFGAVVYKYALPEKRAQMVTAVVIVALVCAIFGYPLAVIATAVVLRGASFSIAKGIAWACDDFVFPYAAAKRRQENARHFPELYRQFLELFDKLPASFTNNTPTDQPGEIPSEGSPEANRSEVPPRQTFFERVHSPDRIRISNATQVLQSTLEEAPVYAIIITGDQNTYCGKIALAMREAINQNRVGEFFSATFWNSRGVIPVSGRESPEQILRLLKTQSHPDRNRTAQDAATKIFQSLENAYLALYPFGEARP